ncbi:MULTISPECIES: diacylglycerol kinase family protein [unclassified Spiroplasma]|uniref:diacylglycerol kinase family protein n=1 Tax=unclassified Spiroplasma TaxID=2637901 RepID=UPI0030CB3D9B
MAKGSPAKKKIFFKLRNKFSNAFRGIYTAIKEESSLIIHIIVSLVVIGLGIWLQKMVPHEFSYVQWAILLLTIGIVIGFELINTMVENFVDLLSFEYNIKAKKIKDICAAATLINSILAIAIGLLIMLPPLVDVIKLYLKIS